MSVDTRTPRTPTGDRSSGFDDAPALSMVKVPSDPAQVIVNHASFRVQLGASTRRTQSPRIARHPSATADTGPHRLLQAVRGGSVRHAEEAVTDAGATQVIPRVGDRVGYPSGYPTGYSTDYDEVYDGLEQTVEPPVVGHQRAPAAGETRL